MFALLFIRDVLVLFMSIFSLLSVYAAQTGYMNTPLITVFLGLLIIVVGNYMPKLPHNWFEGKHISFQVYVIITGVLVIVLGAFIYSLC